MCFLLAFILKAFHLILNVKLGKSEAKTRKEKIVHIT